MTSYGLPMTGGAVSMGALVFDQVWLLILGLLLVLGGALVTRMSFRRGKTPLDV